MSIRYSIAKSALRVLGFKKMFQLPLNRLIIKAEHLNKNRNFQIPKNDGTFFCIFSSIK